MLIATPGSYSAKESLLGFQFLLKASSAVAVLTVLGMVLSFMSPPHENIPGPLSLDSRMICHL